MRSAGRSVAPDVPPAGDGRGTSCPVPQWPGPAAVASSPRGDGRRTRATASWSGARRAAHAIAARFHRGAQGAHRRVHASRRALCGVPGQSRAAGAHPRRPRPSARPGGRHRPWPALDRPPGAGQAHGTAGATWRCRSIPNSPGCQGLDVEAGADRCRSRRPAGASGPTSCPVARSHRMAAGPRAGAADVPAARRGGPLWLRSPWHGRGSGHQGLRRPGRAGHPRPRGGPASIVGVRGRIRS